MYIFFDEKGEQVGVTNSNTLSMPNAVHKKYCKDYDKKLYYALSGDELVSHPIPEPTEEEVAQDQARFEATAYITQRKHAYPTIGDQLDDLYHNGIDGWKATIKAVKDKYPKLAN